MPPQRFLSLADRIEPADGVDEWVRKVFLDQDSPLWNVVHDHLRSAHIGWLWTNKVMRVGGVQKAGKARIPKLNQGDAWLKLKHDQQLVDWFGKVPDFEITLYAPDFLRAPDIWCCALKDHELGHCGQKMKFGFPVFTKKTNRPVYAMRGHDFEQFNFVVERYGAEVAGVMEAVKAARKKPLLDGASIAGVCATCSV